jgi:hypothetical protein
MTCATSSGSFARPKGLATARVSSISSMDSGQRLERCGEENGPRKLTATIESKPASLVCAAASRPCASSLPVKITFAPWRADSCAAARPIPGCGYGRHGCPLPGSSDGDADGAVGHAEHHERPGDPRPDHRGGGRSHVPARSGGHEHVGAAGCRRSQLVADLPLLRRQGRSPPSGHRLPEGGDRHSDRRIRAHGYLPSARLHIYNSKDI